MRKKRVLMWVMILFMLVGCSMTAKNRVVGKWYLEYKIEFTKWAEVYTFSRNGEYTYTEYKNGDIYKTDEGFWEYDDEYECVRLYETKDAMSHGLDHYFVSFNSEEGILYEHNVLLGEQPFTKE